MASYTPDPPLPEPCDETGPLEDSSRSQNSASGEGTLGTLTLSAESDSDTCELKNLETPSPETADASESEFFAEESSMGGETEA